MTGVVVLVVVLLVASLLGVGWQRRNGTIRNRPVADRPQETVLTALGVHPGEVTMLQFSSAFCAPCRATRAVLAAVADEVDGVRHVEVDAESQLAAVRELKILRTPTTIIVDRDGIEAGRATGTPRRADVLDALAPLVGTAGPDRGTATGA